MPLEEKMSSLLDTITDSISPDTIRNLASNLGESPDAVQKGLQTGAASLLSALAGRANEPGFMAQAIKLIQGAGMNAVSAAAAAETSSSFINQLFGANRAAAESRIAQASGLSPSSGGTILEAAAPLVLSTLASKVMGVESGAGLSSVLAAELPKLRGLIPEGLSGVHSPSPSGAATAAAAGVVGTPSSTPQAVTKETEKAGDVWLWPVLLLGALFIGVLVWYFSRGASAVTPTTAPVADTASPAAGDSQKAAAAALGEFSKRKLPDGVELNIPKLGVENKLIDFIESRSAAGNATWFDFDRLLFDTGSATLQPASEEQLQNVAAILKAYPKVHIRIGGYTDNTGGAAANLKLSDARANTVMAELVNLGVSPARLRAKGYGEEHPVAPNDTGEGRQKNRRISMRVTKK